MKILITGGGGFIGSHLVEYQLNQGHFVRTIDLHTDTLGHLPRQDDLEIITGDITDKALMKRLLSGINIDYFQGVNVEATVNLLKDAYEADVSRFVHCSSNGVVGEIQEPPADETTPCRPTNIYEKTKLAGEQAAQKFGRDTGFQVVIARPAWVYGPRCPRTEKLIRTIGNERFVMFGKGRTLRHPLYISDALHGLERCALADVPAGELYFLAGEEAVTIAMLVNTIAELQNVSPPRLSFPLVLGKAVGVGMQTVFKVFNKRPPFSRRSLDFFIKDNAYDISKARRELGFAPEVSLREGLIQTLISINDRNPIPAV
jgi:nucleoside-diphosphate-sugar epimerase